jgi:hypothetical protein
MVKGGEAVHEDLYKSGNLVGWFRHELPFCIGHGNQLLKGKKIMIQSLKALPQQLTIEVTTTKEEDTMSTNYSSMTIEELEELAADLFQEGAEIHQNRSAYETDEEWKELLDMTTTELTEVEEAINQKKETTMSTTKKILCGHCKEYHNTPAEVAECYGVTRKSTSKKQLVQETEGYTRTWFETQKEAVQFLKGLGDIKKGMTPAKNGHGYWTYQAKS